MHLVAAATAASPCSPAWPSLPAALRALHIAPGPSDWLADALAADSACRVTLEVAVGKAAGLERLREAAFDAILVTHQTGTLDALELIEGCRAGGAEEAIVVLGHEPEHELGALCYEVGADAYLCLESATTRSLLWTIARAVHLHEILRENGRLRQCEQSRLKREHDEAESLLGQQRALLGELETLRPSQERRPLACGGAEPPTALPPELAAHYRELLRTYVIMGSGNLSEELQRLASLLVAARLTAGQTMQLHLQVLEELVRGLGARSARHVMTRADLLALEVMVHLAEGYRRKGLGIRD